MPPKMPQSNDGCVPADLHGGMSPRFASNAAACKGGCITTLVLRSGWSYWGLVPIVDLAVAALTGETTQCTYILQRTGVCVFFRQPGC